MVDRNRRRQGRAAPSGPVDGGVARLVPDPDRPRGWELHLDGAPQSHVDLDDPAWLGYAYQRRLGHIIDLAAPPGAPVAAVHLGGGAFTLARYVVATRPRSTQQIAEPDTRLTAFVREWLPLPDGRIKVRGSDARRMLERLPEGQADLVVTDVFAGARTPAHCTSGEFLDLARRALRPGGWYAANLTDGPPLAHLRRQLATFGDRFGACAVIADPAVLRGRRFGNAVLVATDGPLPTAELTRRAAGDPHPARLLTGRELTDFTGGAPVVTDADATDSPAPPEGTFD
ncbi:spermidine synthase [Streptomyces otsuchiensis]|uniref:spermidine synthase n=1 Tax=Streptomyces otsuchiensis TaxID=2681388 RepID=UPI0010314021|nr:fused MFS/spermidine synthase [Streptomyces otsuchiensis]